MAVFVHRAVRGLGWKDRSKKEPEGKKKDAERTRGGEVRMRGQRGR